MTCRGLRPALGNGDPALFSRRLKRGIHDSLRASAVMERGHARSLVSDSIDELEILIVTKNDHGIALACHARRTGPFPKLLRHKHRLERGSTGAPSLQFI